MKKIILKNRQLLLIFVFYISLVFVNSTACFSYENLDEVMSRKTLYSSAAWGPNFLEDATNNYIWQPESLQYLDTSTGKEVWFITRGPDIQSIYGKDHGANAWNYNGSSLGIYSTTRLTNDPAIASTYRYRWLVNTDGSGLRVAHGYGRRSIGWEFNWSRVENAYYSEGSGGGDQTTSDGAEIYKNTLGFNNSVTGALVYDTGSTTTSTKQFFKDGTSQDGTKLVLLDSVASANGDPNAINTTITFIIDLTAEPVTATSWGVGRMIGPSGDPYGTHINSSETDFHDMWSPGPSPTWIMADYSGTSDIFVTMDMSGSDSDGGPQWSDWTGSAFGEIRVESTGDSGSPVAPYTTSYFGHPAFDRWGKYTIVGTYTDYPTAGTRIWDSENHAFLSNYVAESSYDGQHHSWNGWTDHVVMVDPIDSKIYGNTYTGSAATRYEIADPHFPGLTGNYSGYPRPSQSPDGTKVAFAATWLNNGGDDYPDIAYAVAYYPHPPEITSTTATGETVTVRVDWDLTGTSKGYTKRGWPDEATDDPPPPREVKQFRLWRSASGNSNWSAVDTTTYDLFNRYNVASGTWNGNSYWDLTDTPGDGTWYYAVTSQEHSGLESRTLSNVFSITVSNGNGIGSQSELYPSDPKGDSAFYIELPLSPLNVSTEKQATPGQYRISWAEPADLHQLIRYYNIYYSVNSLPEITPRNRIASLPKGITTYLDWLADPSKTGYYRITSVDYQGNESTFNTIGTVEAPVPPVNLTLFVHPE